MNPIVAAAGTHHATVARWVRAGLAVNSRRFRIRKNASAPATMASSTSRPFRTFVTMDAMSRPTEAQSAASRRSSRPRPRRIRHTPKIAVAPFAARMTCGVNTSRRSVSRFRRAGVSAETTSMAPTATTAAPSSRTRR